MDLTLRLLLSSFLVVLASCAGQRPETNPQYEVVTDISHTMALIIDPAADIIWSSSGSIVTVDGEQDLSPTTLVGWNKVEAAAAVLAESGNLLLMPERSAGPGWNGYASGLINTGKLAMTAAQQQDASALFDAGGRIYQVCLACHKKYLIENSAQ